MSGNRKYRRAQVHTRREIRKRPTFAARKAAAVQRNREQSPAFRRRKLVVNLGTFLFVALIFFYLFYAFVLRGMGEPSTQRKSTNTDPVRYRTEKQLKQVMSIEFPMLSNKLKKSYVVPGMKATETLTGEFRAVSVCTSMTPQGMCVTDDYLLISAYCHAHKHNSVLYMLDRTTGAYIKTIALAGQAHVGGMAYDEEHRNVWVSGGVSGAAKAVCYTLDSIEQYDISAGKPLRAIYNYTLATIVRNSYMTYADGSLLIGLFRSGKTSGLEWFHLNEEGGLNSQISASYDAYHEYVSTDFVAVTSGEVQSAAQSDSTLLLSKSYGPYDSVLQVHTWEEGKISFRDDDADKTYRFPQKLEQICIADGQVYCLFESPAYCYRAQPVLCIDRVLVFDLDSLI